VNPKNLSEKPPEKIIKVETTHAVTFAGPLPPPEVLERYNQILTGAAERIIAMAESQSSHRRELEKKVVNGNVFSQNAGMFLGFIIAMTAIIGGIWLASKGMTTQGLAAILAAIAAPAGVFVYAKHQQRDELDKKKPAAPNGKRR
jgi:uncharacterized membrane protein